MSAKAHAVRDAAARLAQAIAEATAAGYRVDWPASPAGLPGIAVSETGAVRAAPVAAAEQPPQAAPSRLGRRSRRSE